MGQPVPLHPVDTASVPTCARGATARLPPLLRFDKVTVTYGKCPDATVALSETTLDVPISDFVALLSPSGCGKPTLVRIAGNLLHPTSGHVFLRGREIGAEAVRMGMAYQSASMLPCDPAASSTLNW